MATSCISIAAQVGSTDFSALMLNSKGTNTVFPRLPRKKSFRLSLTNLMCYKQLLRWVTPIPNGVKHLLIKRKAAKAELKRKRRRLPVPADPSKCDWT